MNKVPRIGIYRIVNVLSQKVYIGQTTKDFNSRWSSHIGHLKVGTHPNRYLQEDWNTFGESAFVFEVLKEMPPDTTEQEMDAQEAYWISQYKDNLYNIRCAGRHGFHSDETKKRMSEAGKFRDLSFFWTDEACRKRSAALSGKVAWNKGIPHTEEHKKKIKEAMSKVVWKNGPSNTGKVFSEEWRKHIGDAVRKRRAHKQKIVNNGVISKYVNIEDLNSYLEQGWLLGMVKRRN